MRKPRVLVSNKTTVYHVTVQANTGEEHFQEEAAREMYRQVLMEARGREEYTFTLISLRFCGNWIDLQLRPEGKADLSLIMQWVQSRFAQRWNKAHKTFGSVWRDRFWSEVIEMVQEAKEWMEEVFEQVKGGLFHKRVKIWSINERIEKKGRSKSFDPHPRE